MGLRRQGVYGVDDVVVAMAVKEFGEGFVLEEGLDRLELERWVDRAKTLSKHCRLSLPDSLGRRYELAIDIGGLYGISIDDRHAPYPCTSDEFGCIASYTTEADDEHMARCELPDSCLTEEELSTLRPRWTP